MRKYRRSTPLLVAATLLAICGCAGEAVVDDLPTQTTSTQRAATPPPPPPQQVASASTANTDQPEAETEAEVEMVKAETGVGKKGRGYGGGIISEPVRAYFRTGQRLQFLQIDKGMREFKAMHDRAPESHEEFMEKIVKQYGVSLPELPVGEKYVYDPEKEELMVQKPAS